MSSDPPRKQKAPVQAHKQKTQVQELVSESALLSVIIDSLSANGLHPDLNDDCAFLTHETDLVTTDVLVEGVHFDLAYDTPEQVGAQAAVVNLSDLAGSGGAAGWLLWSLVLPEAWTKKMVYEATDGLGRTAVKHGARIVGGNLARSAGPAVLSVTAGGPLAGLKPLLRNGAAVGDTVWASGCVGDAALGYRFPDPENRAARHRWRPHLNEASALMKWGHATAGIDVSDGLLKDCQRLAETSGVGIELQGAKIPVSSLYERKHGPDLGLAMTGGEDYILLFTAPHGLHPPVQAMPIGTCTESVGVRVDGQSMTNAGFDHFEGGPSR